MNLTGIYKTFHQTAAEYTFFSSTHRTFSRTDGILGHETNVNKFQKTEFIPNVFSNHNGMKLVIHSRKNTRKLVNMWKLNNILLNNGSKKKSKGKLENCLN